MMGLTFEANGEELFQLKKRCLDVAEVSHLYIYFAGSRMVGLCICDCLQIKGAGLLEMADFYQFTPWEHNEVASIC